MDKTITIKSTADVYDCISNQDLAVLADWAATLKNSVSSLEWKRAFSSLKEGADSLLRRRALAQDCPPNGQNKEKRL